MDASSTRASTSNGRNSDDALRVLGRVADAFDNPSLHKADNELFFVVNVVSSRRVLTSPGNVCGDVSYDSSLDEDVGLGDVDRWERARSYLYGSRRRPSQEPRGLSKRDDGMYDVTKMLLTSSPLDRLDRLARMELKKAGWIERVDKWTVVEMGLAGPPLPSTFNKRDLKSPGGETSGDILSNKTTSPIGERHASRRYGTEGLRSPIRQEYGPGTPERRPRQFKLSRSTSTRSRACSRDSDSHLNEFSPLSYVNESSFSYTNITTPIRASLGSHARMQEQGRGGLGRVVRRIVKRMLPPSSGGDASSRSISEPSGHARGIFGDWPSGQTSEMTPRSNTSAGSGWTFASASSRTDTPGQKYLECQRSKRWSGFWH